jgi:transposase
MSDRQTKAPKVEALRRHAALNPQPDKVTDPLFGSSDFFDSRDLVQVKYEMVRRVRVDGQSVTRTAAAFGFSRPSFYQAQSALEREGLAGLVPKKRGPRHCHKLSTDVIDFLLQQLSEEPSLSSSDLAARIWERFERKVHPRSIERALARHKKKRE